MRKMTWLVALAGLVLILGAGCEQLTDLDKPVVTLTLLNNGGGLRLTWAAITDADGYRIKAGDSTYTTTALTYDVTNPVKKIEVIAYSGTLESDPAIVDCGLVETSSLVLYGKKDPDPNHPSGLAFTSTGTATAMSLGDANKPALDYVCDDESQVVLPIGLGNAGDYGWPQNTKGNALKNSGASSYDAVKIADPPGGYSTSLAISNNAVYYLWLDAANNGWDASDHYAKAQIVSIENIGNYKKVTLKVGWQKVGGLRWLVN